MKKKHLQNSTGKTEKLNYTGWINTVKFNIGSTILVILEIMIKCYKKIKIKKILKIK